MERLTEKVNDYWITNDKAHIYYLDTNESIFVGNAIDRLAELEDVLEKYGIENLEEYISALNEARKLAIKEKKTQFKKYIEEVTKREKIEQELAELKQKAIVPKFVVGQEIWDKYLMAWKIKRVETHQFDKGNGNTTIIEIYRLGHDGNDDYSCCILPSDNDIFFATKEEAEQKLAQLKGKE